MKKVGIIDSGVEVAFLREQALRLAGAASFTLDLDSGELETRIYDADELEAWRQGTCALEVEDTHGHGTAVLSLLHAHARPWPDVELYVARIFGHQVHASSLCLVEALDWMLDDVGVDLLNLSLGTTEDGMEAPMREVIDRAVARGAVIVCSAGALPTLPARLPSVMAVGDLELMDRVAGKGVKVDHVVSERTVRIYMGGAWHEAPMTTSYACAVTAGGLLRGG
ncbi:S8/S53 family peptidase [Archangium primigenium]|uniref:S8/S53 family peptidase n=1 Tax=[Archangium] primigenium TaxID=2792470 RepID=UPI001956433A|nr:S8/S53 family peptidase [Archangium primigenium]MBM7115546.1 S8/S53 family peptidase [Archangium primigenium]